MTGLKTYRITLLLFLAIKTAFVAHSQNKDTLCIPIADAIDKLTKAAKADLLEQKVLLLNDQIFLLGERIKEKEQQIAAYEQIGFANDSIINSYKKEIEAMQGQRKILDLAMADSKKEIRRYRRKLFWRTVGGAVIVSGITYMYIVK